MGVEISSAEPMTSDLDIYRAANLLIKQHGDEASIHAAMRADEILVPQSLPADRGGGAPGGIRTHDPRIGNKGIRPLKPLILQTI